MPSRIAQSVLTFERGRPVLYSRCPEHGAEVKGKWVGKRTSVVRGKQPDLHGGSWDVFRCTERGGHLFNSKPVKDAPTNYDELQQWLLDQRVEAAGIDMKKVVQ